jgi:hypothetical protein
MPSVEPKARVTLFSRCGDNRQGKQIEIICRGKERRSISETESTIYRLYEFHTEVDFMESLLE